ncbi:unnamed protein product [Nippostrongylus brasiliensis]|uniref:L-type lectin-like domain-containing protein n=1 Tax=Nippostrongylus brasiliensis TaxID=27835 RepID=A0A3P7BNF6_NIPBR|nr:unnamed protein product [Nippostrongylus brasiliensis]
MFLPQGYRVGVSAATGDLYSAHSVISLRVFQISERLPDSRPQEVMFKGPYHTASAGSERDSDSHMDLWTFINLCVALALVVLVFYALCKITDKYIVDGLVLRPKKRREKCPGSVCIKYESPGGAVVSAFDKMEKRNMPFLEKKKIRQAWTPRQQAF